MFRPASHSVNLADSCHSSPAGLGRLIGGPWPSLPTRPCEATPGAKSHVTLGRYRTRGNVEKPKANKELRSVQLGEVVRRPAGRKRSPPAPGAPCAPDSVPARRARAAGASEACVCLLIWSNDTRGSPGREAALHSAGSGAAARSRRHQHRRPGPPTRPVRERRPASR